MLKFFLHKKFWMPMMLLLLLMVVAELLLRLGIWDNLIRPQSLLGNAIYRQKAIAEFGLDKIESITVGDSKIDWGINHGQLKVMGQKKGINHLRMSFEASNFMAMQSTVDWSIENMPNLKSILLGVSEDNFGHYSNVQNQYQVSWPFRDYYNPKKYHYFNGESYWRYWHQLAISGYFKDIRHLLFNFYQRVQEFDYYRDSFTNNEFNYNRQLTEDSCGFDLTNLKQCVKIAEEISKTNTVLSGAEQFIVNECGNNNAKYRNANNVTFFSWPNKQKQELKENWRVLFSSILTKGVDLKIVVLPEHGMFNYVVKPSNTTEIFNDLINEFAHKKGVEVLDLRKVFTDKKLAECYYFNDLLHINNRGKSLITRRLIDDLYFEHRSSSRKDRIIMHGFE